MMRNNISHMNFECFRALEKMEYLVISKDNFSYFSSKPYVVTPYLNRLNETVQMRGHNIWFRWEIRKIILNTPSYLELSVYSNTCWSKYQK